MITITKRKPASVETMRRLGDILTRLLSSHTLAESESLDEQTRRDLRPRERQ